MTTTLEPTPAAGGGEVEGEICCEIDPAAATGKGPMPRRLRAARAVAGLLHLALAGWLATRQLPGDIALWPVALVPAWFGISHLIAGLIGYYGCPELGAIPSVMAGRRIETGCGPWERYDRWLGAPHREPPPARTRTPGTSTG